MSTLEQVVPPGYKQTEVGVIPVDWNASILGQFVHSLEAGISVNSVDKVDAFSHGLHILKTSCVSKGYFYPDQAKSIIPIDVHRAKTIPLSGSIIVSRMNTPDLVGELGFVDNDYQHLFLPDRLWQMRFHSNAKKNTRWLAYILSFPPIAKKIKESATGTSNSMKNISKSSLLTINFPSPSFKEQTAIANALSDVDALLSGLEKLIAKKQAIKTATMQQLLTGKTRLPAFATYDENAPEGKHKGQLKGTKSSELGEIPEDWEVKNIGEIASVSSGGTPNRKSPGYWDGNIPWVTTTLINGNEISYANEYITSKGLENSAAKMCPPGTILMAMYGQGKTRGKVGLLTINATINQACAAIMLKEQKLNAYILHVLKNMYEEIRELSNSGGQENLSNGIIKGINLVIPPIKEQTAIATILTDMDEEIQALEQRLAKSRQIKQGMMQELLTGKTRLPFDKTGEQTIPKGGIND